MDIAKAEGIIMDGLQFGGDGGPPTVGPVPMAEALKVRRGCRWGLRLGAISIQMEFMGPCCPPMHSLALN